MHGNGITTHYVSRHGSMWVGVAVNSTLVSGRRRQDSSQLSSEVKIKIVRTADSAHSLPRLLGGA